MKTVFVTGATGNCGFAAVESLLREFKDEANVIAGYHTDAKRDRLTKLNVKTAKFSTEDKSSLGNLKGSDTVPFRLRTFTS